MEPKLEEEKPVQPPAKLRIDYDRLVETEEPEGSGTSGSVPQTPCSRVEGDYYHFRTSTGWYCFDDYRNVYAQDGTLVHDAFEFQLHETDPSFYIDTVPYWFHSNGLLSLDADGTFYCVPTWTNDYYFHTSSGWYFFDDYHNVYLEDGTLVHDASLNAEMGQLLLLTFCIDGASYWFELDALWCRASTDTVYRVCTWRSEPGHGFNSLYCFFASGQFYYLDIRRNLYSEDGTLIYDGSSSLLADKLQAANFYIGNAPYWLHTDGLLSRSDDGTICRVVAWTRDLCSLNDNPDPLEKGLEQGMLVYSPDPSCSNSPSSMESTSDGREMPDTSLFAQSDPDHIQGTSTPSQHKTARKAAKKAQPVKKHDTKDHLCCPICGKEKRRPVALIEHMRIHTVEKPRACPFEGCDLG
ncbi:hypothetical protein RSOL_348070 [Rhizoctonia solani AG-3 Rhs1AP]|uniref:C2H2-type domain-containing protein n=1 Tax=Rhizoctonia solani AG-3 Rhs1AP TaxID=1086054 RepID=X8JA03_9AGAM|nr:hypothetical protein RSOL_348070 [Rhizoctonia solani AG-3 Rhs1AP]